MRNTILLMALALVTPSASSSTNDFGAEEDSVTNDTFYYSGNKKINLFYDPTKVVIFDFNESKEEVSRKKKVMGKFPPAPFTMYIDEEVV